jgi:hypothetical protein
MGMPFFRLLKMHIFMAVALFPLAVLQSDHTWIVAPVLEPYLKDPDLTVANIKAVLQDLENRR